MMIMQICLTLYVSFAPPIAQHGTKLSKYGRASGGILIYVKNSITKFIKHICNFDCGIVVEVSENLFSEPVL